jgi:predicted ATPase/DNA-binding CsgD family transcriptional regulator
MKSASQMTSGSLPGTVSAFVGRTAELVELGAMFPSHRLVTLTGPGGSGKTRLAIEFARSSQDQLVGSIRFVDLSTLTDPELVPAAIGAALNIREQPDERLLDTIVRRIGAEPAALILDNLEQIRGVGTFIGALLAASPQLRVLATSRAPLRVRGEREFPVRPLPTPSSDDERSLERLLSNEAITMFTDRARSIDTRFEVTEANAAALAEICRRLDGLPLAIELAAARTHLFGPIALLARLDQRLPLLAGRTADAPARQRTLHAAIAWSVDLLAPDDRVLFAALAVFVGGFTATAAAAVVTTDNQPASDLVTPLERLVDHNLVTVTSGDDEPRFGMLETIREFAMSQLSADRLAELRERHLAFFVTMVEEAHGQSRGADQGAAISRVIADRANLRAALIQARAAHPVALARLIAALNRRFWYAAGGRAEGLAWFAESYRSIPQAPPTTRVRALGQGAWMLNDWGDRARARELFAELFAMADALDDDLGRFESHIGLAYLALDHGQLQSADRQMEEAMLLATRIGHPAIAEAMTGLGFIAWMRGDKPAALSRLAQAVSVARSSGDAWAAAAALIYMADIRRTSGEVALAETNFREAGEQAQAAGDAELAVWARIGLGRTATLRGDLTGASQALLDAGHLIDELGPPLDEPIVLDAAADLFSAARSLVPAVEAAASADRARRRRPWSQPPEDVVARARFLRAARKDLGVVRFQAARKAGENRTLDEATTTALRAMADMDLHRSQRKRQPAAAARLGLTEREQQIVGLVTAGLTDGEIATSLVISKKTASVHVANVNAKLGARSRVEIATMAIRLGLVDEPSAGTAW